MKKYINDVTCTSRIILQRLSTVCCFVADDDTPITDAALAIDESHLF